MDEVTPIDLLGLGLEASGVAAVVGLGEAEGSHNLTLGQLGEEAGLLLLRSVGVDGVHHQGGLDTHGRAVAAVHPEIIKYSGERGVLMSTMGFFGVNPFMAKRTVERKREELENVVRNRDLTFQPRGPRDHKRHRKLLGSRSHGWWNRAFRGIPFRS